MVEINSDSFKLRNITVIDNKISIGYIENKPSNYVNFFKFGQENK